MYLYKCGYEGFPNGSAQVPVAPVERSRSGKRPYSHEVLKAGKYCHEELDPPCQGVVGGQQLCLREEC